MLGPTTIEHLFKVNKRKEKFVILQSIGIIAIKVVKQGQSSTPADILVGNVNP